MNEQDKARFKRDVSAMPIERIRDKVHSLMKLREIALRRARAADTEATKVQVAELEERLAAIKDQYGSVDTGGYPNVVVSSLAKLQGQEYEIRTQLRMWKNAKEVQNTLDEQLAICNSVVVERSRD